MNMKLLIACLVLGSTAMAQHTTDSLDQVKQGLAKESAILIDVREQGEWDAGHLKMAQLVPLSELKTPATAKAAIKGLPKDKVIYCHCLSGGRVIPAAKILRELGFDVRPLEHSYKELVMSGFEQAPK